MLCNKRPLKRVTMRVFKTQIYTIKLKLNKYSLHIIMHIICFSNLVERISKFIFLLKVFNGLGFVHVNCAQGENVFHIPQSYTIISEMRGFCGQLRNPTSMQSAPRFMVWTLANGIDL